jgi:putative acetyltransferase
VSAQPPVRVRTALRSDLAACAALWALGQQEIEPRVPPWRAGDFTAEIEGEELYVAAAGDALAGLLTLWRAEAFVHFLHVARAWRRHGVGRLLLATAQAEAARPLELKCLAANAGALRFYQRLGWRPVRREADPAAPYLRLRGGP